MTVLEVLGSCTQRIQGIRLPVAEVESTLQLAQVVNDIQACINTLTAHAEETPAEGAAEEPEAETPEETNDEEKAGETE